MAQLLLALLQARVLNHESTASWFDEYLRRFLSHRARRVGVQASIVGIALNGIWKNAGNAEFARAWRPYVKGWIRWCEHEVMPRPSPRNRRATRRDNEDLDGTRCDLMRARSTGGRRSGERSVRFNEAAQQPSSA
jgi:hypothetical protein